MLYDLQYRFYVHNTHDINIKKHEHHTHELHIKHHMNNNNIKVRHANLLVFGHKGT